MRTLRFYFATVTRRISIIPIIAVLALWMSLPTACGGDDTQSRQAAAIRIVDRQVALGEPDRSGHVALALGKAPKATVTISLSSNEPTLVMPEPSSITFGTSDWDTARRIDLLLKDDDVFDGTRAVELVATITDGPREYTELDPVVIALTVTDDERAGFEVGAPSGTTTERSGQASFDLRLTSRPRGKVTLPVASEDVTEGVTDVHELTFDETNWDQHKVVVVTGQDDGLADGEQSFVVALGPALSEDPGYDGRSDRVTLSNADDEIAGIVVSKVSGRSDEGGGQATFNVSLASQPKGDVRLSVTTSDASEGSPETAELRFTPVNWLTPTPLYVTGVDDEVDDGAQIYDVVLAIDETDDEDYRLVVPVHLPVYNDDDDVAGVTVSAASGATTEAGGAATFTLALDTEPTATVKLTLGSTDDGEGSPSPDQLTITPESWREPRIVTVTGIDDDLDDGTQPYAIEVTSIDSPDPIYTSLLVEPVDLLNEDDEGADVYVGPLVGTATESGGQATFTVVLASQPSAAVTIPVSSADPDEAAVTPISLVFTPLDWNAPQQVILTGQDDDAADGPIEVPIHLGPAVGSDTTGYAGRHIPPVVVTNVDNDSAGVLVGAVVGTATESGRGATFTVALASRPRGDVVMPLVSADPTELAVTPATVTFTAQNWAAPRTITVNGVDDTIADGSERVAVNLGPLHAPTDDTGYDGLTVPPVLVDNADDDTARVLVSDLVGTVSEAGGSATFTVVLATRPTANVTVPLSSSREGEATVSPGQLTFTATNWSSPQTVAVKGVDDAVPDGNQPFQIRVGPAAGTADASYRGLTAPSLPALNLDNDTAGIVLTAPTGQATEAGAAATFTVVLRSQPTADVTLAIASLDTSEATVSPATLVFTAANWNAPQSVRVPGVDDALADGAQPVSIRIGPATSNDVAYHALAVPDALLTVTDNDSAGILVGAASGTPTEAGGQATFTVALASRPTSNVVLALESSLPTEGTVSQPALVFTTTNWGSPQTVTVTGQDDTWVDGDRPFAIDIGPAVSGDTTGYAGMAAPSVSLVNVDDDTVGVVVSDVVGAASEGGDAATFAISLRTRPAAPVTISLSATGNAEEVRVTPPFVVFGPDSWTAPQLVTITGRDDDLADGDQQATIALGPVASEDAAYARLVIVPAEVTVTNLDDDTAGVLITNFQGQPTESGGQATFSVALRTRPAADVTVTASSSDPGEAVVAPSPLVFTPTNWASPRLVIATGVDDDTADGNQPFEVQLTASSTDLAYHAAAIPPVSMVTLDDDSAGVVVGPVQGTATEGGGQAVLSLTLRSAPTADVHVALATPSGDEIALQPGPLTFTTGNWNAPQFVFARGVDDALADGNQIARVDFIVTSADGRYAGLAVASAFVVNVDDDSAALVVGDVYGQPTERGGAATFSIRLSSRPAGAVTVPLASTSPAEGAVSPASLVIQPDQWNTLHTVTVTGVDDAPPVADGPRPFRVTIGPTTTSDTPFAGLVAPSVALTNLDDDSPAIEVSAVSGHTLEGDPSAKATFTVRLSSQPIADVTVAVASLTPTEGTASPASLLFTPLNWSAPQTITATGAEDPVADGDQPFAVALGPVSSNDLGYHRMVLPNVIIVNRDNDSAGVSVSAATGQPTEAGGAATFSVRLDSRPTANVVIPVGSSDPGEIAVSPATLTFTPSNWQGLQTITVTGVDDAIADALQSAEILLGPVVSVDSGYAGMAIAPVTLTNQDDDTAGIVASAVNQDVTESGGQATLSIALTTQPAATVEVPIAITGGADEANVNPARLVFTPVNWNAPQVVTLTGLDDAAKDGDQEVTVAFGPAASGDAAYDGLAAQPASRTFKNLDNDAAGLIVSDFQGAPSEAGGQATFWVVLRSQPVGAVTVLLTSSDPTEGTVSPPSLAFDASSWSAPRLVTVTGVDDPEVDGHRAFGVGFDLSGSVDAAYQLVSHAALSLVNADDDSAAVNVSAAVGHCTEQGGYAMFMVSLTTRPVGTVTIPVSVSDITEASLSPSAALGTLDLVFSAADYLAREVRVYGVDDDLVDGDQYLLAGLGPVVAPADPPYHGITLLPVQLDNHDDDAAAIVVSPAIGQPDEDGGAATFTVVLTSSPTAMVTVPIISSDTTEGAPTPTSLTFDASNWSTPRTIAVGGQEDAIADGAVPFIVRLGPTASADLRYHGLQPPEVRLTNLDDGDAVGITAVGNNLTVAETGTSQTFSVRLDSQPTANVVLPITSSDPGEASVSPAQLVFTPTTWATAQIITVRGVDDAVVDGAQGLFVAVGPAVSSDPFYAGAMLATPISVTNADNDTGTLVASVIGQAGESGGTAYLSVRLSAAPTDLVNVAIAGSDSGELAVAPPTVTFTATNWQNAQNVELRGVDDNEADGDQQTTVTLAATSGDAAFHGKTATVGVTTVDDDIAAVIVGDVIGQPTEAGGTASVAIRLATRPTANVTVTAATASPEVSVGPAVFFTPDTWASPQVIAVAAVDDDLDDGDQAATVSFQVTSGDAAYHAFQLLPIDLLAVDDDTRAVIVGAVSGQPSEFGGAATFSVQLATQPTTGVMVTVSSSDEGEGTATSPLVFTTANWKTPQLVTVTGIDDGLQDGAQSYAISFVVAGGDYAGFVVPSVPMTTTDNDSGAGVSVRVISGAPTEAGGTALVGVRLNSQPSSAVSVAVASDITGEGTVSPASLTFDSQSWSQEKTVIVTGVNDPYDDGDASFNVGFDPSGDPAYAGLANLTLPLVNVDDDQSGFVVSQVGGQPTEAGGAATFTVSLTSRPRIDKPVTVNVVSSDVAEGVANSPLVFTNADWAAKTVTVTGQDDAVDDGDQAFTVHLGPANSADPAYDGRALVSVGLVNRDDDNAGVEVVVTGTKTSEAGGAGPVVSVLVKLTSKPELAVTIPVVISDPSEASASAASVTFPASNGDWATGRTVTISGNNDAVADGHVPYQVLLGPAVSNDGLYAGRVIAPIALVNEDDGDAIGITVSETSVTTSESGGSDSFTAVLGSAPTANVVIPIASSDPSEASVAPTSLEFTPANWNIARTVTVTGVDDDIQDGAIGYQLQLGPVSSADPAYGGLTLGSIAGTNADHGDTRGLALGDLSGAVTEAGGSASFDVALASEPSGPVAIEVKVTTGAAEAFVSPASLVFTAANWNLPQSVRITGKDDAVVDGAQTVTVTLDPSGADYGAVANATVSTTSADDDRAAVLVSDVIGSPTEAGGVATFRVHLGSQPSASVTFAVTDTDTDDSEVIVSPTSLTFTTSDWATPQTFAITGKDDLASDGDQAVTLSLSISSGAYPGATMPSVVVSNRDDDQAGVAVRLVSGPTSEAGGTAQLKVRLNSDPGGSVLIAFASSDTTEGTVGSSPLEFTAANWNVEQTVTVTGVHDALADGDQGYLVTFVITSAPAAYSGITIPSVPLVNRDDDVVGFAVAVTDGQTRELSPNQTGSVTVALRSEPSADVTVVFGVSDASEATATGPVQSDRLVFTASNWSTPQTITVTGVDDAMVDGDVGYQLVFTSVSTTDPGYTGLSIPPAALVNVDAGDSVGLLVTQTTPDLETAESGANTAVFAVKLQSQPSGPVTIPVSSSDPGEALASPSALVFTPTNWNTAQSVNISGQNDSMDDGDVDYVVTFGPASSGDALYAGLMQSRLLQNLDDDTRGLVLGSTVGALSEAGGQATITVALATQPTDTVTVTVTADQADEVGLAPAVLTFTSANWNQPQTLTAIGKDDAEADGAQAVTLTLTPGGLGDYDADEIETVALSNADDDAVGILIGDVQGQLTEGGGLATFTLALASKPTNDVEITVTVSDEATDQGANATRTFTPASWNEPQAVVLKGSDDAIDDGDQPVTVSFTVASDDDAYDDLDVPDVSATNLDDDTRGLLVSPVSGQPTEHGGAATFTVRLATEPTAVVTVTLTSTDPTEAAVTSTLTFTAGANGTWKTPQTVTVTGKDDGAADGDQAFAIRFTLTGGDYLNLAAADLLMTNRDNDSGAALSVRVVSGAPTEAGGSAALAVRLNSQPASNVSIAIASSNTAEGAVTSATPLIFTNANWMTEQAVTVTGQPDDVDDGDVAFNVTFDPSGSADPAYKLVPSATLPLVNLDDDRAGALVSKTTLTTTEGTTTDTFTVGLTSQPTHDVTIAIASSDIGEATVSPASLTFTSTDWGAKPVTVTGVNDDLDDGDQTALVNLGPATSTDAKYQGLSIPSVAVVNADNDAAGVTVTTSGTTTSEAGGAVTITIALTTRPTAAVVIPVVVSDPSEASASTSAVSIPPTGTTWSTGVTVTITGVNDAVADGTIAYQILLGPAASTDPSYAGTPLAPIAMTNTDDTDAAALVVSKSAVTTSERGTSDTFTVKLASEPTGTVQVAVASSDTTEVTASPATLTFTPADWSIVRTVTVTGVDDFADDGDQGATITLDPAGANYDALSSATVGASNADDDTVGITRGPVQGALSEEGGIASFTIVLDSQPSGSVQVGVAVAPDDEATVLTPSLTFTAANWSAPQLVQIEGDDDLVVDGPQAVTVSFTIAATGTDYASQSIANVALSNADDDAAGLSIANVQGQPTETGGQATFSVRLASQPTAPVTVAVGVGKPTEATVAPTSITFVAASPTVGQVLWNNPTTITVTGKDDNLADGNQVFDLTLDPSSADAAYADLSDSNVPMVNLDDDSAGVTVVLVSGTPSEEAGQALFRVTLNTPPTAGVTIPIEITDGTEGCLLQGALQACPGTVVTAGLLTFTVDDWDDAQTFIVEGVNDFLADGNIPFDVVLGPAVSNDLFYGGLIIPPVTVTNVEDDDRVGIEVVASATPLATDESGSNGRTFTVVLASEPSTDVHLDLNPVNLEVALNDVTSARDWSELKLTTPSGDCLRTDIVNNDAPHSGTDPSLTGCRLTFTGGLNGNWATPQTVTLTGLNDDYDDDFQSLSLILGNFATHRPTTDDTTGYRFVTLTPLQVTVADDDDAGISYTVIDAYAFEGDPTTATYDGDAQTTGQGRLQVALSSRPTAALTLALAADYAHQESLGTPAVQLPVTTLTIPDAPGWQSRTFVVNALEDCYDDVIDGNTDNAATIGYEASQNGWRAEYDRVGQTTMITTVDDDTADVTVEHVVAAAPDCTIGAADLCGYVTEAGGDLEVKVTLATTPVAPLSLTLATAGTPTTSTTLTYPSGGLTAAGDCGWTGTLELDGEGESNTDSADQQHPIDLTATSALDTRYDGADAGAQAWRTLAVTHLDDDGLALILTPTVSALSEAGTDPGLGTCTTMRVNSATRPLDTETQQPATLVLELSSDNLPYGGGFLVGGSLVATTWVTLDGDSWNAQAGSGSAVTVTVCASDDRRDEATGKVWYGSADFRDAFILAAEVVPSHSGAETDDKTGYMLPFDGAGTLTVVSTSTPITAQDDDTANILVNGALAPTLPSLDEGAHQALTVRLDSQPDGPVTVDIAAANPNRGIEIALPEGGLAPASDSSAWKSVLEDGEALTFDATTWSTEQTLYVRAVDDDIYEPVTVDGQPTGYNDFALTFTIDQADSTGYGALAAKVVVQPTVNDEDAGVITLSVPGDVIEGTCETMTLTASTRPWTLSNDPAQDHAAEVVVALSVPASALTHGGGFGEAGAPQADASRTIGSSLSATVQVCATDDARVDTTTFDISASIAVATTDTTGFVQPIVGVTITSVDAGDTAGIVIADTFPQDPTLPSLYEQDGVAQPQIRALTVRLNSEPSTPVTLTIAAENPERGLLIALPEGGIAPAATSAGWKSLLAGTDALAFTTANWSTNQTLYVLAVDDDIHEPEDIEGQATGFNSFDLVFTASGDPAAGYGSIARTVLQPAVSDELAPTVTLVPAVDQNSDLIQPTEAVAGRCVDLAVVASTRPWILDNDASVDGPGLAAIDLQALEDVAGYGGTVSPTSVNLGDGATPLVDVATVCATDDDRVDATGIEVGASVRDATPTADNSGFVGSPAIDAVTYAPVDNDVAGIVIAGDLATSPLMLPGLAEDGPYGTVAVRLRSDPSATVTLAVSGQNAVRGVEVALEPESGNPQWGPSVELAFTPGVAGSWSTNQTVLVRAIDDDIYEPTTVEGQSTTYNGFTLTFTASGTGTSGYDALQRTASQPTTSDDAAPEILVAQELDGLDAVVRPTEAGGDDHCVVLTLRPTTRPWNLASDTSATVEVSLLSDDALFGATVVPGSIVLDGDSGWQTGEAATVCAEDDDRFDPDATFEVALAIDATDAEGLMDFVCDPLATGCTSDEPGAATVTYAPVDNDQRGVVLALKTPSEGLAIPEGATRTFMVSLLSEPTSAVTVAVAVTGQLSVSGSPVTLTSANWSAGVEVTVSATPDDWVDGARQGALSAAVTSSGNEYDGLMASDLTLTNVDDDSAGLVLAIIGSPTRPNEKANPASGDCVTVQVTATSRPFDGTSDGQVVVDLASGLGGLVPIPSQVILTGANWNAPDTDNRAYVTVCAADDDVDNSPDPSFPDYGRVFDVNASVGGTSSDAAYLATAPPPALQPLQIIPVDDDVRGVTVLTELSPTPVPYDTQNPPQIYEGEARELWVVLDSEPTSAVTVTLSLSGFGASTGATVTSQVTFAPTNWDAPQAVMVDAAEPDAIEGAEATVGTLVVGLDPAGGDYDQAAEASIDVDILEAGVCGVGDTAVGLEECDGDDTSTCAELDLGNGGAIGCGVACTFDTSPCWKATALAVGPRHSCGLDELGQARCFVTAPNVANLMAPAAGDGITSGAFHVCSNDDTAGLDCQGDLDFDNDGDVNDEELPASLTSPASGAYFTCGFTHAGGLGVDCFGAEDRDSDGVAEAVPSVTWDVAEVIAAGPRHVCALDFGGDIDCWGDGAFFSGGASGQWTLAPTVLPIALAAGRQRTCACGVSGVECWGDLDYDDDGQNDVVPAGVTSCSAIAAGDDFVCALDTDGDLFCWGDAPAGAPTGPFATLSAFGGRVCAGRAINDSDAYNDGEVTCWGDEATAYPGLTANLVTRLGFDEAAVAGYTRTHYGTGTCDGSVGATISTTESAIGASSVSFDGNGDTVEMQCVDLLHSWTEATITLWFKADLVPTQEGVKVTLVSLASTSVGYLTLELVGDGTFAHLVANVRNGAATTFEALHPAAVSPGAWHHVALVVGAAAKLRLHVDDLAPATNTLWTGAIDPSAAPQRVYLGRRAGTNPGYLDGLIDELRIYNRALSATEIEDSLQLQSEPTP